MASLLLSAVVWLSLQAVLCSTTSGPIYIIDLQTSADDVPTVMAVQACAGLLNRNHTAGAATSSSVYTLMSGKDATWLEVATGITHPTITPVEDFLTMCMSSGVVQGAVVYNATSQKALLPLLLTVAGVLDGVPVEVGQPRKFSVVFDATVEWAGLDVHGATSKVFEAYGSRTTGLSKMNPGYDTSKHPFKPPLNGNIPLGLADYIVKARLFNFFLVEGCLPGTKEHALESHMIASSNAFWPKPVAVMGYDNSFAIAGDLFEAETGCTPQHSMGQVASENVNNLAFFSRDPAERVTTPLVQNVETTLDTPYNSSKTYVTVIIGDGDNVAYVKGSRLDWFTDRVARCKADPGYFGCFPLTWSMSPHTTYLAPAMLRHYYNLSYVTGRDYFVLPPSGHLYSYPSKMPAGPVRDAFVRRTLEDMHLLNASTSVAWEVALSWEAAIRDYFPLYGGSSAVTPPAGTGFFAVNVPFMIPVAAFGKAEFYKIMRAPHTSTPGSGPPAPVVLFRPREWRGTVPEGYPFSEHEDLPVSAMAAEINNYPRGTVTNLYVTSDGGCNLADVYSLVASLEEHVEVVGANTLVRMALQRG